MNYQNLEQEIKEYTNYFKYCDSINSKFLSFFKQFVKSGNNFVSKSKKSLEDLCNEINKEEYFPSTLNKNVISLCDEYKIILNKLQTVFSNIENELINKVNEFDKNFKTGFKASINNLSNMNAYLTDNKNKLEKTKNNYFDSCKLVLEYNQKYSSMKTKENVKEEEVSKMCEYLEKLKQSSETKKINYRIEVTKLNDILLSNENNYIKILNSISKHEEDRSQFYANIFLLFNNYTKLFNYESKDCITKNEKYIDDVFTKRDIKMFALYFNKTNNNPDKSRFLYEEFYDFENFKNLQSANDDLTKSNSMNNSEKEKNNNKVLDISNIISIDIKMALNLTEIGKERLIPSNTLNNELKELKNIISDIIKKDDKIADEKFLYIINTVEEKKDGCKNFIYLLMDHFISKQIITINNTQNAFLLNSILNIIINFIWENDEYIYLAIYIILIGEKTIYFSSKEKNSINYLCKLMSKNTVYHISDFWNKIINVKIKMIARIKIVEEFKSRKKISSKKDSGLISKIFGSSDNNAIENEILFSQIYMEKASTYLNEVLEEFITHFTCYDFAEKRTINLIEQLAEQYSLNNKQKNYFIKTINSDILYFKNPNPYFNEDNSSEDNKINPSKSFYEFNSGKKFKKIKNPKVKILLFSMKYLTKNEILKVLCLNKEYYSYLKKYLYKNIIINLNPKIDFKKHISIWKIILNYNEIKTKYDYNSLKKSIIDDKNKDQIFEIIELDCIRTFFTEHQEENRAKLVNILKVASKQVTSINYCQGMNHITAFLLTLCDENEEETFYLLLSILLATDYCNLVANDLVILNSYFYCFERLLVLMFPEMYNYLTNNNINGGYFLSPWFITIFTIAFHSEKERDIMIKIFDLFLFSGWKAIFKIGISLLKCNSLKIFSLPYEQLVHFLNNDIIETDFFKSTNLDELTKIYSNFKISTNLIANLTEECKIKQKILDKNNII